MYVSRITPSAFDESVVYLTFDNHREDDFAPYVYASSDHGGTWRNIRNNLPQGQVVRCIVEDTKNPNVLYVGTEFGLYVSLDRGSRWTRVRSNLPTVPIYDIAIHPRDNDLILGTHGRSIWILDDLTPVQQAAEALATDAHLFDIRAAMQMNAASDRTNFAGDRRFWGENPKPGAAVAYYLRQPAKDLRLTVKDAAGAVIADLSGSDVKDAMKAGLNRVHWDLRYEPLVAPRGVPAGGGGGGGFGGGLNGPFVLPGEYRVTLTVNGRDVSTESIRVMGDRLIQITDADRKLQHDTALALHELHRAANEAAETTVALTEQITAVEGTLSRTVSAPPAVKTAVGNARTRLNGLRRELGLGGQAGEGGFGGQQAVRSRIAQVKGQIIGSTSAPTDMQLRATREAREDLAKQIDEANAMIATVLPGVYRTLAENSLQPAPLKPLRAITTSSPQR